MVSKLFLSEYVEASFSSDQKQEKFAFITHVLVNTENVVIWRCCFTEDGYEMYKFYYAHAEPLFCSWNLLFYHFLVAIAVMVC